MSVTRNAQSTQNKFAYLSNISIKAWGGEVEFLPVDKQKRFLQNGSITLGVISQTGPKYKNNQFTISLQYL